MASLLTSIGLKLNLNTTTANNSLRQTGLVSQGVLGNMARGAAAFNEEWSDLTRGIKDTRRIVSGIVISQAFYTISNAALEAAGAVLNFSNNMANATISMEYFVKGSDKAAQSIAYLRSMSNFAANTPFSTESALAMSKYMQAMGVAMNSTKSVLGVITDTASATGATDENMQRIVFGLGQMLTKGRLANEEIRQLANANIPIYEILKEELGLTGAQISNIGNQWVSADKAVVAILNGLDARYKGAADKVSNTFGGMTETIKDNALIITNTFLGGAYDTATEKMTGLRDKLDQYRDVVQQMGGGGLLRTMLLDLDATGELGTYVLALAGNFRHFTLALKETFSAGSPLFELFANTGYATLTTISTILGTLTQGFNKLVDIVDSVSMHSISLVDVLTALFIMKKIGDVSLFFGNAMFSLGNTFAKTTQAAWAAIPVFNTWNWTLKAALTTVAGIAGAALLAYQAINMVSSLGGIDASDTGLPTDYETEYAAYEKAMQEYNDAINKYSETYDDPYSTLADDAASAFSDVEDASAEAADNVKQHWLASFDEVFAVPEANMAGLVKETDKLDFGTGLTPPFFKFPSRDAPLPEIPKLDFSNIFDDKKVADKNFWKAFLPAALAGALLGLARNKNKVKDDDANLKKKTDDDGIKVSALDDTRDILKAIEVNTKKTEIADKKLKQLMDDIDKRPIPVPTPEDIKRLDLTLKQHAKRIENLNNSLLLAGKPQEELTDVVKEATKLVRQFELDNVLKAFEAGENKITDVVKVIKTLPDEMREALKLSDSTSLQVLQVNKELYTVQERSSKALGNIKDLTERVCQTIASAPSNTYVMPDNIIDDINKLSVNSKDLLTTFTDSERNSLELLQSIADSRNVTHVARGGTSLTSVALQPEVMRLLTEVAENRRLDTLIAEGNRNIENAVANFEDYTRRSIPANAADMSPEVLSKMEANIAEINAEVNKVNKSLVLREMPKFETPKVVTDMHDLLKTIELNTAVAAFENGESSIADIKKVLKALPENVAKNFIDTNKLFNESIAIQRIMLTDSEIATHNIDKIRDTVAKLDAAKINYKAANVELPPAVLADIANLRSLNKTSLDILGSVDTSARLAVDKLLLLDASVKDLAAVRVEQALLLRTPGLAGTDLYQNAIDNAGHALSKAYKDIQLAGNQLRAVYADQVVMLNAEEAARLEVLRVTRNVIEPLNAFVDEAKKLTSIAQLYPTYLEGSYAQGVINGAKKVVENTLQALSTVDRDSNLSTALRETIFAINKTNDNMSLLAQGKAVDVLTPDFSKSLPAVIDVLSAEYSFEAGKTQEILSSMDAKLNQANQLNGAIERHIAAQLEQTKLLASRSSAVVTGTASEEFVGRVFDDVSELIYNATSMKEFESGIDDMMERLTQRKDNAPLYVANMEKVQDEIRRGREDVTVKLTDIKSNTAGVLKGIKEENSYLRNAIVTPNSGEPRTYKERLNNINNRTKTLGQTVIINADTTGYTKFLETVPVVLREGMTEISGQMVQIFDQNRLGLYTGQVAGVLGDSAYGNKLVKVLSDGFSDSLKQAANITSQLESLHDLNRMAFGDKSQYLLVQHVDEVLSKLGMEAAKGFRVVDPTTGLTAIIDGVVSEAKTWYDKTNALTKEWLADIDKRSPLVDGDARLVPNTNYEQYGILDVTSQRSEKVKVLIDQVKKLGEKVTYVVEDNTSKLSGLMTRAIEDGIPVEVDGILNTRSVEADKMYKLSAEGFDAIKDLIPDLYYKIAGNAAVTGSDKVFLAIFDVLESGLEDTSLSLDKIDKNIMFGTDVWSEQAARIENYATKFVVDNEKAIQRAMAKHTTIIEITPSAAAKESAKNTARMLTELREIDAKFLQSGGDVKELLKRVTVFGKEIGKANAARIPLNEFNKAPTFGDGGLNKFAGKMLEQMRGNNEVIAKLAEDKLNALIQVIEKRVSVKTGGDYTADRLIRININNPYTDEVASTVNKTATEWRKVTDTLRTQMDRMPQYIESLIDAFNDGVRQMNLAVSTGVTDMFTKMDGKQTLNELARSVIAMNTSLEKYFETSTGIARIMQDSLDARMPLQLPTNAFSEMGIEGYLKRAVTALETKTGITADTLLLSKIEANTAVSAELATIKAIDTAAPATDADTLAKLAEKATSIDQHLIDNYESIRALAKASQEATDLYIKNSGFTPPDNIVYTAHPDTDVVDKLDEILEVLGQDLYNRGSIGGTEYDLGYTDTSKMSREEILQMFYDDAARYAQDTTYRAPTEPVWDSASSKTPGAISDAVADAGKFTGNLDGFADFSAFYKLLGKGASGGVKILDGLTLGVGDYISAVKNLHSVYGATSDVLTASGTILAESASVASKAWAVSSVALAGLGIVVAEIDVAHGFDFAGETLNNNAGTASADIYRPQNEALMTFQDVLLNVDSVLGLNEESTSSILEHYFELNDDYQRQLMQIYAEDVKSQGERGSVYGFIERLFASGKGDWNLISEIITKRKIDYDAEATKESVDNLGLTSGVAYTEIAEEDKRAYLEEEMKTNGKLAALIDQMIETNSHADYADLIKKTYKDQWDIVERYYGVTDDFKAGVNLLLASDNNGEFRAALTEMGVHNAKTATSYEQLTDGTTEGYMQLKAILDNILHNIEDSVEPLIAAKSDLNTENANILKGDTSGIVDLGVTDEGVALMLKDISQSVRDNIANELGITLKTEQASTGAYYNTLATDLSEMSNNILGWTKTLPDSINIDNISTAEATILASAGIQINSDGTISFMKAANMGMTGTDREVALTMKDLAVDIINSLKSGGVTVGDNEAGKLDVDFDAATASKNMTSALYMTSANLNSSLNDDATNALAGLGKYLESGYFEITNQAVLSGNITIREYIKSLGDTAKVLAPDVQKVLTDIDDRIKSTGERTREHIAAAAAGIVIKSPIDASQLTAEIEATFADMGVTFTESSEGLMMTINQLGNQYVEGVTFIPEETWLKLSEETRQSIADMGVEVSTQAGLVTIDISKTLETGLGGILEVYLNNPEVWEALPENFKASFAAAGIEVKDGMLTLKNGMISSLTQVNGTWAMSWSGMTTDTVMRFKEMGLGVENEMLAMQTMSKEEAQKVTDGIAIPFEDLPGVLQDQMTASGESFAGQYVLLRDQTLEGWLGVADGINMALDQADIAAEDAAAATTQAYTDALAKDRSKQVKDFQDKGVGGKNKNNNTVGLYTTLSDSVGGTYQAYPIYNKKGNLVQYIYYSIETGKYKQSGSKKLPKDKEMPAFKMGGIISSDGVYRAGEFGMSEAVIPLEQPAALKKVGMALAGAMPARSLLEQLKPILGVANGGILTRHGKTTDDSAITREVKDLLLALKPALQPPASSHGPSTQRPLYVNTLIASQDGLKELNRQLKIVEARQGG